MIEVNLSQQWMTLYKAGAPVFGTAVATRVRGAETPTGPFMVHYKVAKLRMRGVTPSGVYYHIPDVPWVLAFWGDFTFHSAPWRSQFGFPRSNGCVSMPTAAAKYLYDWAPVGTPIRIHY